MRRGGLFVGITLLVVGLLLLLSDLGVIAVDVWSAVWAVLLIALGLSILWGVVGGTHPVEGDEVAIPLEGASRARVRARHGAGCLRVTAGAASDVLVEGTFSSGLDYRARRVGEELDVEMSPRGFPFTVAPWNWGRGGLGWILALNGQIPLSRAFETGASDASLDLRNVQVTDLRLATGASSVNVRLPAGAGHTRVHIEAGAASVSIGVPTSVAARVRFEGGLAAIDVDESRFPRTGGVYQSPDYDSAENKVDIEAKAGAGSLNVH